MSVKERLLRQAAPDIATGCLVWIGCKDHDGYGRIFVNGKARKAHRVSYEEFVGPIAAGLTLNHICRNRPCIEPTHLEQVTKYVNSKHPRRSHCIHGHSLSGDNLLVSTPKERHVCRSCVNIRSKRYYYERKQK